LTYGTPGALSGSGIGGTSTALPTVGGVGNTGSTVGGAGSVPVFANPPATGTTSQTTAPSTSGPTAAPPSTSPSATPPGGATPYSNPAVPPGAGGY
jgi:hypothetical protein